MVRWSGLPAAALDRDPAEGVEPTDQPLARAAVSGCRQRCHRAVCYWVSLLRGRLNEPRRLDTRPELWPTGSSNPAVRRHALDGWKSWSVSAERWGLLLGEQAELLYSGGDERYVRGRSAYQRGLCTSPRVGEEDEGRSQRAVATGRAKNKRSLHAKVW